MRKALVLGASGGIGSALVNELVSRGTEVTAVARGKEKLEKLFGDKNNVSVVQGDALIEGDVLKAVQGMDVIFHAVGFPYQVWKETHPPCIDIMIKAARKYEAKIVMADNVYAYGKQYGQPVSESAKKEPHTKKGKMRLQMENALKESGVPVLIAHLPDVYGPNAESTMLHETLKNAVVNKPANFVGDITKAREFLYTKDAAKAMVELALRDDTYNQNWNIPAAHPITGKEILEIIREETGYEKPVRAVSKSMIRLLGLFNPFMRELVEMMYLTEEPVVLSGDKYENIVGPLPRTPYREGLKETISWLKEKEAETAAV
ncbi:SDR family NAD(P)-dependent oxidoreductase [Evansella clarkii]|uniref:SDR family NAD(P)-dependent oxidoreductase n=1 Tax=Evansella clarkii TaxID=79879 RepID=UPI000998AD7A|nr:SDR family NAD(P)-dependent oxidoreductase [Evansella clarkii]